MIRVLPITILFLFAFVGFTVFKSFYDEPTEAAAEKEVEQLAKDANSSSDAETDAIIAQLNADLSQLEPAAGDEKPKEPVSEKTEGKPEVKAEGKSKDPGEKDLPSYVKKERPTEQIPDMTKSGKELLEQMAVRRTELDEWKKDLDLRASLIEASSHKLDDKIAKLEELKAVTQKLLDEYKVEDNNKIKSMVKVYENMKPKDAATVFNQLDMPILLEIVEQMNERRLSAVLAKMDSTKAKDITEKIMKNRNLAKM